MFTKIAGFAGDNGEKNKRKMESTGKSFTTQHDLHAWRSDVVDGLLETFGLGSVIP
ncbi:hypothetical protein V2A84_06365 [Yersinia sp. 2553 StPb PI]|uniref:hypothetical protein n=1 Tax=Yersinia sp. 2553 StPb PI TaxID=3117411 RepID=UPI003FA495F1